MIGGKKEEEVTPRGKENRVDDQEGSGDRIQASVSPTQTHNIEETLLSIY